MYLRSIVLLLLVVRVADGQAGDSTPRPSGTGVSGIVRDSIARAPLVGARVHLVALTGAREIVRSALSDALGSFYLVNVPDGRYALGFVHPLLDSLGLEPVLREILVADGRHSNADLGTPSPARLRRTICRSAASANAGTMVFGIVRDTRGRTPIAGASVTGQWIETTFRREGPVQRTFRIGATTGSNGWFALCDVPREGSMTLDAIAGTDSTDRVEIEMSPDRVLRRDLWIGPSQGASDGGAANDAFTARPRRAQRTGPGRLTGVVVALAGAQPISGAQVGIVGSATTRTNERGEWTLSDVPAGTRTLDVSAAGFSPQRIAVDVEDGAAPVRVAMQTVAALLQAMRVRASSAHRRELGAVLARSQAGGGYVITADQIARRRPMESSDIFDVVPGMKLESHDGERYFRLRGCAPAFYLDGRPLAGLPIGMTSRLLDAVVRPIEIAGIEVRSDATTPTQFQQGMNGCGSVSIWSK